MIINLWWVMFSILQLIIFFRMYFIYSSILRSLAFCRPTNREWLSFTTGPEWGPHTHELSNCPPQEMSDRHEYFIVTVFRSDRRLIQIYSKCGLIGTHDRTAAIRLRVWLMTLSMMSGSLSALLLSSCPELLQRQW